MDSLNIKDEALAYLRRESLDIYNRVYSIAEDCEFVRAVRKAYPDLPVVPNLRCGAWYVDPTIASGEAAYFKSTDGHFNNWSFNLRRPNVHLLPFIVKHNGLILVDSTRSGKRLPDALSKTVPIWCAVVNRAVQLRHEKRGQWDTALYTSPAAVSRQEHSQIEARLDDWVALLNDSTYDLPALEHPLRPFWITPSTSSYPSLLSPSERRFYPIICISASMQIEEGLERRLKGFSYIQGSGDDHELWGQGLTPDIFWQNKDQILSTDRSRLPDVIRDLVAQQAKRSEGQCAVHPTRIAKVHGRLLIGKVSDLPQPPPPRLADSESDISYVLISEVLVADPVPDAAPPSRKTMLRLQQPEGKRGQKLFLETVLPQAVPFVDSQLSDGKAVCICCDSGKDASIGVVLTALQLFFNDSGEFLQPKNRHDTAIDKKSISTRLQWIITSRPQANPSRATLKRVNEFLMTSPALRGR